MIRKILILIGMLFLFSSIPIQAFSETTQDKLLDINAQYTSDWSSNGFLNFLGNNLSENNFITTDTTQLHVRRVSTNLHTYDLQLRDSQGGALLTTNIPFSGIEGVMVIPNGMLKPNETYHINVTEWDTTGRITGLYTILYFSVTKYSGMHNPPTIYAYPRTVEKDDPNFDIREGVTAYDEEGTDITSLIEISGQVDIHKEGIYPITYSVVDRNGLSAHKEVNISVVASSTDISPPNLDMVTDNDLQVTGRGTAGLTVFVILGIETYKGTIREDGTFIIPLEKKYAVGTGITSYIEDSSGNQSTKIYAVVQQGSFVLGVNRILSSDSVITGNTVPNAQIEVTVDNYKSHIFYGVSDNTGMFSVLLNGNTYPAGTPIHVVARSSNQTSSTVSVIVYPKDVTISSVAVGDRVLRGEADPFATVYVSIGNYNYVFNADAAGNFSGNISPIQQGDRILIYQVSNGIKGDVTELVVNTKH